MHYTEGPNVDDEGGGVRLNKDSDGGTTVNANFMNAIAGEIIHVIVDLAGMTLRTTGALDQAGGWTQLGEAITSIATQIASDTWDAKLNDAMDNNDAFAAWVAGIADTRFTADFSAAFSSAFLSVFSTAWVTALNDAMDNNDTFNNWVAGIGDARIAAALQLSTFNCEWRHEDGATYVANLVASYRLTNGIAFLEIPFGQFTVGAGHDYIILTGTAGIAIPADLRMTAGAGSNVTCGIPVTVFVNGVAKNCMLRNSGSISGALALFTAGDGSGSGYDIGEWASGTKIEIMKQTVMYFPHP